MSSWHIRKDQRESGPFETEALLGQLGQDQIGPDVLLRLDGSDTWVTAHSVLTMLKEHGEAEAERSRHNTIVKRMTAVSPRGTMAIFALCLIMFSWAAYAGGTKDMFTLIRFGANYPPLTLGQGQWWRLVGATFMHIGTLHLAVNMISLLAVATRLEQLYGTPAFLALYAVSGFAGSVASALRGDSVSAGASGALFGLCGAVVVIGWRYREEWPSGFRSRLGKGMLPMIAYNLAFGFANSGIDNSAHLGGLAAGCLFAWAIKPAVLEDEMPPPRRVGLLALGLVPFLVQAVVVYHAVKQPLLTDLAPKVYRQGDLSVTLPAVLVPGRDSKEPYFTGPGFVVIFGQVDDPRSVVIDNPWFLQAIGKVAGTVLVKPVKINGRTWVLRDAVTDTVSVRQGFAYIGSKTVKVEIHLLSEAAGQGDRLRLATIETLRVEGYDALQAAAELAKASLYARTLEELHGAPNGVPKSKLEARALIGLSRFSEARVIIEELEKAVPSDRDVIDLSAFSYQQQGDYAKALADYRRRTPDLNDPLGQAFSSLAEGFVLERLGHAAEAQAIYDKALRLGNPLVSAAVYNNQAWNLILNKRYREALPLAQRAVSTKSHPTFVESEGRAYFELGQREKAKAAYLLVLKHEPNMPVANYFMARIFEQEGDLDNARTYDYRYLALAGDKGEFAKDCHSRLALHNAQ